jgi:hypothetical protein
MVRDGRLDCAKRNRVAGVFRYARISVAMWAATELPSACKS